ncbi:hypothetical protein [Alkalisalibacterium limincola]|uniref:hypothetical protein n=1 Tax=Alkalisalibacterium limincola TaxID=2699169 RepID=UPI0021060EB3|nr:hypothetical protein [Alkalisalibacterium limincola]
MARAQTGQAGLEGVQATQGEVARIFVERAQGAELLAQALAQADVGRVVEAAQQLVGQHVGAQRAGAVVGQLQPLLAHVQQQFHFVQAQRHIHARRTVVDLCDRLLEQRRALAHAEHFLAQHPLVRGVVADAALHLAQGLACRLQFGFQRGQALLDRVDLGHGVGRGDEVLLQPWRELPGCHRHRGEHEQHEHEAADAAWLPGRAGRGSGGPRLRGGFAGLV